MSDTSARLDLPLLQAAQAQKHITHNEALARLDLLVQLAVQGFDVSTPPALPDEGQIWATGANPTDAWAGQPDTLAAWVNGAWVFVAPKAGWIAADAMTGTVRVRSAAGWGALAVMDLDNLDGIGIATSHDGVNRLAVASEATLLSHAGAGHQVKVNKAAATDTASLLFQTAFSGRAEMGTAGTDDFAIKVSADGSTFRTGASFDSATGRADFPNGARISGSTAFHRANILGSVTQTGGVPTGAIIERGSNANGSFVRFADGTQICSGFVTTSATAPVTWAYPVPFVAVPSSVQLTASAAGLRLGTTNGNGTATSIGLNGWDTTGGRVGAAFWVQALGAWF